MAKFSGCLMLLAVALVIFVSPALFPLLTVAAILYLASQILRPSK